MMQILRLVWGRPEQRVQRFYSWLGSTNTLCERSQYLNLGYWGTGAQTFDDAGDAMAQMMADAAGLNPTSEVLDVGCGLGDQDFYWVRKYGVKRVVALNITETQVAAARERCRAEGLDSRIDFRVGDAVHLPIEDETFDVVMALESAFHFRTRDRFIAEAFRVLKPGGRLVMTDLCGRDEALPWPAKIAEKAARRLWQVPGENVYDRVEYARRLRRAGFAEVNVQSIWDQVFPTYLERARERLKDRRLVQRMDPTYLQFLRASLKPRPANQPDPFDYVFVAANKGGPAAPKLS